MSPHTKKLCNAESAADVMGPVDKGDRIMAKKGANKVGNGTVIISSHANLGHAPPRSGM
jgi:hypothetical protein